MATPTIAAVIVAAGRGARMGSDTPKQYHVLGAKTVIAHAVHAFISHPRISHVHIVVTAGDEARAAAAIGEAASRVTFGTGGQSRQESVHRGLCQLAEGSRTPDFVLVHDAARPLVSPALIDRVTDALADAPGACPALPVVDSLRQGDGDYLSGTISRDNLWRAQTPQGFHFKLLKSAHETACKGATDDVEIMRQGGHPVRIVAGDEHAMKITHMDDLELAHNLMRRTTLSGTGFDVHRFGPGDHIWLCGVKIPHDRAMIGHSDADVALHALTDAILGAIADGDIGTHFPPGDPQWKGASSARFLTHAADLARSAGGRIVHCDLTIIAERPKIGPWRAAMMERLRELLADHRPRISVKATTTEGLGFTGRREGIAAQAIATLEFPTWGTL